MRPTIPIAHALPGPLFVWPAAGLRRLARLLTAAAEALENPAYDRLDAHLDREAHLAELRQRICSRYY